MNLTGTAAVAARAGHPTGEAPLEAWMALPKAAQEQTESQARQLIQAIEAAGSANSDKAGLDTYG